MRHRVRAPRRQFGLPAGNLYFKARYGSLPDYAFDRLVLPDGYVPSLAVVYLAWLCILALMYGLTLLWLRVRSANARRGAVAA